MSEMLASDLHVVALLGPEELQRDVSELYERDLSDMLASDLHVVALLGPEELHRAQGEGSSHA